LNTFQPLPADLKSIIGTAEIDFSILSKRNQPLGKSYGIIGFGTIWTAFVSIFVIAFLGPLFKGEEVHFKVNDEPTTGSWENFEPMLVPSLLIGLFVIVGIALLIGGFYSLFQKGGYFVGTPNRLIHYRNGTIKTYDWEQFSGNIEVNSKKEDISLEVVMINPINTSLLFFIFREFLMFWKLKKSAAKESKKMILLLQKPLIKTNLPKLCF
jgi:hypothetical protein